MLSGRKIVVTGAASGIGLACAKVALRYGAKVTLADLNAEALEKLRVELGENCDTFVANTADPQAVKALTAFAAEKMGGLDGWVNNVGIGGNAKIWEMPDDLFAKIVNVNLLGTMYGIREAAAYMVANEVKGSIVNISSLNSHIPYEGMHAYCSTKAAITMLTRTAGLELARKGIRINSVAPGVTDTPANAGMDAEFLAHELNWHMPLNRMANPDEIAEAVCFLLSDRASYVCGTELNVDGGTSNTGYPNFNGVLDDLGIPH